MSDKMTEKTAGDEIVERLAAYHNASTDVLLAEKIGKEKQHIYSMRKRTKRDVNYDVIMHLLNEIERLQHQK